MAAMKKGSPKKAAPAKKATPPKPAAAKKAPAKAPARPVPKAKPVPAPKAKAAPAPKAPPAKAPPVKAPPAKAVPPPKPAAAPPPKAAPAVPPKAAPVAKGGAPPKAAAPAPTAPPAAPKLAKKPTPPTLMPAVSPVVKPIGQATPAKVVQAPLPPQVRVGAVDGQLVSAIHYGLFAAINKTFGSFGQSVLKNASLRILEYGYKRQWLPPKSKDPIKALNEFFQRLETMGYAEKIHVAKKEESYVCEVVNLTDWDAVADLKELHYPLLPIFMAEIILAFLDQYFKLIVAIEPTELVPEKRGLRIRFTTHERTEPSVAVASERPLLADFED